MEQLSLIIQDLALQQAQEATEAGKRQLQDYISQLVNEDFEGLVSLLYRQDVSEKKLRDALARQPATDAAALITDLLLERMAQKIKSRQAFSRRDPSIPDEEKW